MDALQKRRELDAIGGTSYLAFLTEGIPRHPNIESYVRIIKDKSLLRQMLGIFTEGMALASDQSEPATDVLNTVEARLAEMADSAIQRGLSGIGGDRRQLVRLDRRAV
jgi:replicative DNA helicase